MTGLHGTFNVRNYTSDQYHKVIFNYLLNSGLLVVVLLPRQERNYSDDDERRHADQFNFERVQVHRFLSKILELRLLPCSKW
jgi:hypothetical protein